MTSVGTLRAERQQVGGTRQRDSSRSPKRADHGASTAARLIEANSACRGGVKGLHDGAPGPMRGAGRSPVVAVLARGCSPGHGNAQRITGSAHATGATRTGKQHTSRGRLRSRRLVVLPPRPTLAEASERDTFAHMASASEWLERVKSAERRGELLTAVGWPLLARGRPRRRPSASRVMDSPPHRMRMSQR